MKTRSIMLCALAGIAITGLSLGAAWAADAKAATGDPYPLDTCPVTGEKLGAMGDQIIETINGREVRFCCAGCVSKYKAKTAEYDKKMDAAIVEQQKALYPLDTCVVLGGKLDAMGGGVDYIYQNRLVRFCCKGCIGKFEKEPGKYLAILDKAVIEKQKAEYPLDTCIASGEKLGGSMGEPVDFVMNNHLFRLCCASCADKLKKDPIKYTKILDDARKAKAQTPKK